MDEQTVQSFWQDHACGDDQIGGLHDRFRGDYEEFFTNYDRFRYQNEPHLPTCLDALNVTGKRVLEIGLGEGSDSERLIRQGARWSGVDLTAESVERVRARLTLRELPYEELHQGSVLHLPFPTTPSTWCSAMASCIMCLTSSRPRARSIGCSAPTGNWS